MLTQQQKELIDRWISETNPPQFIDSYNDLPPGLKSQLIALFDFETMWQDIDRYVSDNAQPTDYFGGRW